MRIRELIELLKKHDPEMTVVVDQEGYEHVAIHPEEITLWGTGFKAFAIKIGPEWCAPEPTIADFDKRFLTREEPRPEAPSRFSSFNEMIREEYSKIVSEHLKRGLVVFDPDLLKKDTEGETFVEFKVHKERDENEGS